MTLREHYRSTMKLIFGQEGEKNGGQIQPSTGAEAETDKNLSFIN